MNEEDNTYRRGSGNTSGFIVEWRLNGDVRLVEEKSYWNKLPKCEWSEAPYSIEDLQLQGQATRLITPVIAKKSLISSPFCISHYGLVEKTVADAIIACYKTKILADPCLSCVEDLIEFRATELGLTYSFEIKYMTNSKK